MAPTTSTSSKVKGKGRVYMCVPCGGRHEAPTGRNCPIHKRQQAIPAATNLKTRTRVVKKQDKPRASTPEFFSDSEEEEPSDTGPDSALDSELSELESMSESTPVNVVRDKGKSRCGHKGTKNVSQRKEAEDSTVGRLSRTPVQGGKRRRGPDEHQVNPTPTSRGSKRNASRSLSPDPKRRKSQPAPHLSRSQAGSPTIERVDCEEQRGISLILEQLHSMKADHAREVARVETEAQQERARLQAETARERDAMHEALAQVHVVGVSPGIGDSR